METHATDALGNLAAGLPVPQDYLEGIPCDPLIVPRNILAFSRRSPADLHQPTLENQSHHRFVLVVPLKGKGSVSLDRAEFPIEPGAAMLFFPFQFHHYLEVGPDRINWLFLTFEGVESLHLAPCKDLLLDIGSEEIEHMLRFLEAYRDPDASRGPESHFTLGTLLHQLVKQAKRRPSSQPEELPAPQLIGEINSRLAVSMGEGTGIASIARELGISASHLRRQFRETYGSSLGRYLHGARMHRAASWLATSDLNVGEVADRCGYSSQASFTRAFRQEIGLTPRDYRKLRSRRDGLIAEERRGNEV